jgi:uncharacterized protein (TIGR03000 family)
MAAPLPMPREQAGQERTYGEGRFGEPGQQGAEQRQNAPAGARNREAPNQPLPNQPGNPPRPNQPGATERGENPAFAATQVAAPATIVVRLPVDTKLTIEGHATRSTSALRTFTTPPLEPGREFEYTLKAELTQAGRTQTTTTQVTVRAGEETFVTIEFPRAVARR